MTLDAPRNIVPPSANPHPWSQNPFNWLLGMLCGGPGRRGRGDQRHH
ncbi:hypothetical protein [Streptomyces sp. NPDC014995]